MEGPQVPDGVRERLTDLTHVAAAAEIHQSMEAGQSSAEGAGTLLLPFVLESFPLSLHRPFMSR
jgi:hypothetical protein